MKLGCDRITNQGLTILLSFCICCILIKNKSRPLKNKKLTIIETSHLEEQRVHSLPILEEEWQSVVDTSLIILISQQMRGEKTKK